MLWDLPLLDAIPAVSPHLRRPDHMAAWASMLESTVEPQPIGKPIRGMCAYPTRHHKTWTTLHGAIWIVGRKPTWRVLYIANENDRALWLGTQTQKLRDRFGMKSVRGEDTKKIWSNDTGGGITVMSREQSSIGYDAHVVIADDPLDENGFEDPLIRDDADRVLSFYASRSGGGGQEGAVLLVMSRGHEDDPFQRRKDRKQVDWADFSSPAIVNEGLDGEHAFAPEVWSLDALKHKKAEMVEAGLLRTWRSQWQNDPMASVVRGFGNPVRGPAPQYGRWVFGVDLAYSKESHADNFALVVAKIWQGTMYVVDVIREKRDLETASHRIQYAMRLAPGAAIFSYISGPEKGAVQYLNGLGIPVIPILARTPKYNRSQKTKDAWNAGRLVVGSFPNAEGFIARAKRFTGAEDAGDDDEIDALVSACDGGLFASGAAPSTLGTPRIGRYGHE
jgi:hypothetical protein